MKEQSSLVKANLIFEANLKSRTSTTYRAGRKVKRQK